MRTIAAFYLIVTLTIAGRDPDGTPTMSKDTSVSLVNLGDLGAPVDTFIKRLSDAVGCLYAPQHTVKMAHAESEALYIKTQGEIAALGLRERARLNAEARQIQQQRQMESIAGQAAQLLDSQAKPEALSDDWLNHFFARAKDVSDDQLAAIWAKILAGEAQSAGSYSKRTLSLLAEIDRSEAEAFAKVCAFSVRVDIASQVWPIIFEANDDIFAQQKLFFSELVDLESLGLIQQSSSHYHLSKQPKHLKIHYFAETVELVLPSDGETNELQIGSVVLTKAGRELSRVCTVDPIPGFISYLRAKWKEHIPKPVEQTTN